MASTDVEEEGADVDLSMTIDLDTPATSPTGKHIDLSATIDLDDSASMPPDSPRTGLLTKEEMMGQDLAASGFAEYDSDRENNDSPKKAPSAKRSSSSPPMWHATWQARVLGLEPCAKT